MLARLIRSAEFAEESGALSWGAAPSMIKAALMPGGSGPVGLDAAPREGVALSSLIETDNKLFNKVLLIFTHLCDEVSALRQHARRKAARAAAGALVRRGWRCVLARRLATLMRAQQRAPWHMLHDDASGAFYFQHVESGEVSWEAPEGGEAAYRPQVVDRFSGRWVLAWPQLERPKPLALQQPREGYCMACKLEPATRRCDTCAAPRFELVPPSWGDGHFHFCFACFYTHHDRSPAMKAHKAVLTRALTAPPLTCCVCAEPATRRCRGLVLPPRGRFILQRFLLHLA